MLLFWITYNKTIKNKTTIDHLVRPETRVKGIVWSFFKWCSVGYFSPTTKVKGIIILFCVCTSAFVSLYKSIPETSGWIPIKLPESGHWTLPLSNLSSQSHSRWLSQTSDLSKHKNVQTSENCTDIEFNFGVVWAETQLQYKLKALTSYKITFFFKKIFHSYLFGNKISCELLDGF